MEALTYEGPARKSTGELRPCSISESTSSLGRGQNGRNQSSRHVMSRLTPPPPFLAHTLSLTNIHAFTPSTELGRIASSPAPLQLKSHAAAFSLIARTQSFRYSINITLSMNFTNNKPNTAPVHFLPLPVACPPTSPPSPLPFHFPKHTRPQPGELRNNRKPL